MKQRDGDGERGSELSRAEQPGLLELDDAERKQLKPFPRVHHATNNLLHLPP